VKNYEYGAMNGQHDYQLDDCSTDFIEAILQSLRDALLLTVFNLPFSSELSRVMEQQLVRPSPQSMSGLHQCRTLMQEKYDSNNEVHEAMLEEIWTALTGGADREGRITKQWGELGFQGKDPGTDFRGTGFLGVTVLHCFAKTHTESCKAIMEERSGAGAKAFPLALGVISTTDALVKLMEAHPYAANAILHSNDSSTNLALFCELFSKVFTSFTRYHHGAIERFIQDGGVPELARMQYESIHKKFFGALGDSGRLVKEWRDDGHARTVQRQMQQCHDNDIVIPNRSLYRQAATNKL